MTRVNAGWIGKDAEAPESVTTFAEDQLGPLYAASWVPINRSALRYTDPAVDAIVTADLGQGLDDLIDRGILFGTGTANQPTGLLTQPPAALTRDKANAPIVSDDLFFLKQALMTQWRMDDATSGLRWVTNPAVVDRLRTTSKKETGAALSEWPQSIVSWDVSSATILDLMLLQSGRIEVVAGNPPGRYHLYLVNGGMGVVVYFGGASVDLIVDPYTLSTSGAVRITGFVDVNCVARDPNIVGALLNCQTITPPP
jgi:HK97 family phage major capsid protein